MSLTLNDTMIEALAQKLTAKITREMNTRYGAVVTELAKTRETNEQLSNKIADLEEQFKTQNTNIKSQLHQLVEHLRTDRADKTKAAKLLEHALNELGME